MERNFSFLQRQNSIERMEREEFDLLIIGGGITGAATARDAASRGLRVALVEKNDFAHGTSSRSSKLIHGGLRYLENMEFGLVFEALSERAHLLRTAPHLVQPLPFLLPVYESDKHGKGLLSLGLWLYDLLALFRAPGFHRNLSKDQFLQMAPLIKEEGLKGGFYYYDASMWDDALAIETLRACYVAGVPVANYLEALRPIWTGETITGFTVRDRETDREFQVRAKRVVSCVGPWIDVFGQEWDKGSWKSRLTPSKGIHLIFDLKKLPVTAALVMSHPSDGRIAFVIPRMDFGAGVAVVGTTDAPSPKNPDLAEITEDEVQYLMNLLKIYFPKVKLSRDDILSGYVGVRPLFGSEEGEKSLQKLSREHHIELGPGLSVLVMGGKYTTHRSMAKEIVDFTLKTWPKASRPRAHHSSTEAPVNPLTLDHIVEAAKGVAQKRGLEIPTALYARYGEDALQIVLAQGDRAMNSDPEGFAYLEGQLRFALRRLMVMHLEDFYFRRVPLYASRSDHGLPWAEKLAQVWKEELGKTDDEMRQELDRLRNEIARRSKWKEKLQSV